MEHSKILKRFITVILAFALLIGMIVPASAAKNYSSYGSLEEVRAASAEINREDR